MTLAHTLAALLLATATLTQAAPLMLISDDEAQREATTAAQAPPRPRSMPLPPRQAPAIEVLAPVPEGTHRVVVRVADEKGRIAERELMIRVSATR